MAGWLRHVPVLFGDADLLDERHSMPICGGFGLAAPDSRLKPHHVNVPSGGFIDVSRNRLGPAKDHDEINRTAISASLRPAAGWASAPSGRTDDVACRPEVVATE
jgi:hypothetical protein